MQFWSLLGILFFVNWTGIGNFSNGSLSPSVAIGIIPLYIGSTAIAIFGGISQRQWVIFQGVAPTAATFTLIAAEVSSAWTFNALGLSILVSAWLLMGALQALDIDTQ